MMKLADVKAFALSLPEVTEEPHHQFGSFKVRGKIFLTMPPDHEHVHLFVSEPQRELALAMYPTCCEKLLWGGKVVGLRITLASCPRSAMNGLVRQAWENKAPKALLKQ